MTDRPEDDKHRKAEHDAKSRGTGDQPQPAGQPAAAGGDDRPGSAPAAENERHASAADAESERDPTTDSGRGVGSEPGRGDDGAASPPRRASAVAWIAFLLALLAVLLIVAAVFFGWWRLDLMARDRGDFARADTVAADLRALNSRIDEVGERIGGGSQAFTELRDDLEAADEARREIEQRLEEVAELASAGRESWRRSEAAYLATVADHRLRYYRDVDAALDALRSADELLSEFGGEAVEARRGIARAIDALIDLSVPRVSRTADRLTDLAAAVEDLPMRGQRDELAPLGEGAPEVQSAGDDWRARLENAWEQFRSSLAELVVVSDDRRVAPLRTPEERFFLAQSLRLQLDTARLAALQHDQDLYDRSLGRAAEWLDELDSEQPGVTEMREAVVELQDETVRIELPDIADMLAPTRAFD